MTKRSESRGSATTRGKVKEKRCAGWGGVGGESCKKKKTMGEGTAKTQWVMKKRESAMEQKTKSL